MGTKTKNTRTKEATAAATTVKIPPDLHEKLSLIKVALRPKTGRTTSIQDLAAEYLREPVEAKFRELGLDRTVPV